jgi:hypothetical protein
LSNTFLGYLKVPKIGHNGNEVLFRIFRDLQAQGSQLLKHAFRPKEHLVLDFGTFKASWTYKSSLLRDESGAFLKSLHKASLRVDLYWDEDDTQALRALQFQGACRVVRNCLYIDIPGFGFAALQVLAWTTHKPRLYVIPRCETDSLSFIAHFKHIDCLELTEPQFRGGPNLLAAWVQYVPPSLKKLVLSSSVYDTSNLHTLTSLKCLCVHRFTDFYVKKLPPNLVELIVPNKVANFDSLKSKLHPTCKLTLTDCHWYA